MRQNDQEKFAAIPAWVRLRVAVIGGALLAVCSLVARPALAAEALPKLGADLAQTSVSGLSSGAYMAGQLQVAHSKDIVGAGIVAGGPFACAETDASLIFPFWPTAVAQNAAQALYACMKTTVGEPDPARSVKRAKDLAEEGAIDPLSGLATDNVYLFSGNDDQTVTRPVVKAAEQFYKEAGVSPSNMTLVEGDGGHAFLTEEGGAACGITDKPYVSDCDYDQAKAILSWIYGPLADASPEPQGRFAVFDQQPFAEPGDGFADEGVVYVPPACEQPGAGCRVHIALHGCAQSRETVGDAFVKQAGFVELADQNRLIVLFPQAKASAYNPEGCWDWWGYTGLDYLGKDAPQIKAIWAMVEQLAAAP
ncbi:MAG TPA: PHB depolymerase family esterase [Hyphomicrobiaceae bacterium]|jgi:poly(3-hydroxybutyrate) depolymerase|nr:PHB depolymerase family esterase [Hyphomicrobiaceae bacterium]